MGDKATSSGFELVIPSATVNLGGQAVTFRGLSFSDVATLVGDFSEQIDQLVSLYDGRLKPEDVDFDQLGQRLLLDAPRLLSMALALAMDASDVESAAEQFTKAPGGFQLLAFEVVFKLTTEPAGGAKEFFARLSPYLGSQASL